MALTHDSVTQDVINNTSHTSCNGVSQILNNESPGGNSGDFLEVTDISAYDSDEENEHENIVISLTEDLKRWSLENEISHTSLNGLLTILNKNKIKLPKDSRTLLSTPNFVNVVPMGSGKFWYNGIENNLRHTFCDLKAQKELVLIFNIDGIPPFKSSGIELWPILFKIESMPYLQPMAVAIYCGRGKPPLESFLARFVDELNHILENGININSYKISMKIKCFICDTPARSYIKGINRQLISSFL